MRGLKERMQRMKRVSLAGLVESRWQCSRAFQAPMS